MKSYVNRGSKGRPMAGGVPLETLEGRRMLSASSFGPLTVAPQALQGEVVGQPLVNTRTALSQGDVTLALVDGTNFGLTHTPTMIVRRGDGSKLLKVPTLFVSSTRVLADISEFFTSTGIKALQPHVYKRVGEYHIHVELVDGKQHLAHFSESVQVAQNSPLGQTITETAGAAFTSSLGSFQAMSSASAINAQINWGDGQTSAATLTNTGNGQAAAISGSHTYSRPGRYRVKVTGVFETIPLPGGGAGAEVWNQDVFSTVIVRHAKK